MPQINQHNSRPELEADLRQSRFRPFRILIFVLFFLSGMGFIFNQYTENVSMERYCNNIPDTITHLRSVLEEKKPAGDGSTRPYLVAAKLIYLVPQQPDESENRYLLRVTDVIQQHCLMQTPLSELTATPAR